MKIDKTELVKHCLEKEEKDLLNTIDKIIIARNESPVPNETRSDTSRIQADKMLHELNSKSKELKKLLNNLSNIFTDSSPGIKVWSYAEISSVKSKIKLILVPDGYGGREFNGVKLISTSALLGKILYGNDAGKIVTFNDNKYLIEFIE